MQKPVEKKRPEVQACLPLLIKDILRIHIERGVVDTFKLFGLHFRLITFFGRVCGVRRNERCNQRIGIYDFDDGSGRIQVHFNHLKKEFKGGKLKILRINI